MNRVNIHSVFNNTGLKNTIWSQGVSIAINNLDHKIWSQLKYPISGNLKQFSDVRNILYFIVKVMQQVIIHKRKYLLMKGSIQRNYPRTKTVPLR